MAKGIYPRKPLTEAHKANIRVALKGKMPKNVVAGWNKGTKGAYTASEETRRKISEHHKAHGVGKWMKGRGGTQHANWKGGLPLCRNCNKQLKIRHPKDPTNPLCGTCHKKSRYRL